MKADRFAVSILDLRIGQVQRSGCWSWVLGSAAAYHAAKKGARIIGFEQFESGHVRGASHDTSRIVRAAYDRPEYVALAKAAYKDWAELEETSKQKLLTITGGLILMPTESDLNMRTWAESSKANGVPYELLSRDQVNQRWPQFNVPVNYEAVYKANSGMIHASRSVTAMQYMARL